MSEGVYYVPLAVKPYVAQHASLYKSMMTYGKSDAVHANLVSTPREHWQWNWNSHINAHLPNIYLRFEFACSRTGLCINRSSIPVSVVVDDADSLVESIGM